MPSSRQDDGTTLRLDAASSVLAACWGLQWRDTGRYWPGLPSAQVAEFRHVLHHLAVSRELISGAQIAEVHRPEWNGGRPYGHAA